MFRRITTLVVTVLAALAINGSALFASEKERPTIGLVLGGGGAKGSAHIGVLKVLEKHRIPVDHVAGTSMGAIIGALYASGYSADEIDSLSRDIDWISLFNDRPPRERINFRRKQQDNDLLSDFKVSFHDGNIILPQGIIQGQKLYLELSRILRQARLIHDFSQLPIPFRAIAGNLETGEPEIMQEGDLVDAVFASMAVPGLVPPVKIGEKLLVDGGIANNLPIDIARAMGADIVIVVDIGAKAKSKSDIHNVFDVMQQLSTLMGSSSNARQIATLQATDILISPDLGDLTMMNFDRFLDGIPLGTKAAEQHGTRLAELAVDEASWQLYQDRKKQRIPVEPVVEFVEVQQDSALSDNTIRKFLKTEVSQPLSIPQLRSDIDTLYGLDTFSRVSYRMITDDRGTGLLVSADKNPAKESYLGFGLAMETDFDADTSFQLGAGFTRRNLNQWGGEWRTLLQVGSDIELVSDFYQPLGPGLNFFINPTASFLRSNQLYFGGGSRPIGEARISAIQVGLNAGVLLGNWGALSVGQHNSWGNVKPTVGELGFDKVNFNDSVAFARFDVDTLDDLSFPRSGILGSVVYGDHKGPFGGDFNLRELSLAGFWANSWGKHTLVLGGRFQTTLEDEPGALSGFSLGGFLNLSGLADSQLGGRHLVFGQSIYYQRLTRQSPFLNLPVYVGGSLEFGNVYSDLSDWSFRSMTAAGSLFLGVDTPIGPIFFGGGATEHGDKSLYLQIGQTF